MELVALLVGIVIGVASTLFAITQMAENEWEEAMVRRLMDRTEPRPRGMGGRHEP